MSNYTIFTDSACDIRPEVLAEWGVPFCSLTFHFEGSPKEYSNYELSSGEFYGRMRAKVMLRDWQKLQEQKAKEETALKEAEERKEAATNE